MNHHGVRTLLGRLAFASLLALMLGYTAPSADLVTLAGKKSAGALVQVDKDFVTFKEAGGGTLKVPVKEVSAVELTNKIVAPIKDAKFDEVELTDGSVILTSGFKVQARKVELAFLPGPQGVAPPTIDLPLGSVYWLMRSAEDQRNRDDWKKLLAARGKRDLFVLRQPEGLSPLTGTVLEGAETGTSVTFEREDGTRTPLPLSRATGGLVFNQAQKDVVAPLVCKVYDVFGNVFFATAVEVVSSGLKVKTVSGAFVEYPALAAVSRLDFGQGNVTYLSTLDATATYPPAEKDGPLGETFPFAITYQKDRPIGGGEIVLGGNKYTKGVSVPPDVSLVYKLDGTHREFKAVVGILDGVKPDDGVLRVRIELDGRAVFDEAIKKKDKPRDLNLNVKDAKELKITVERVDLFSGNQINFADARLQK